MSPDVLGVYLKLGLAWQAVCEAIPADLLSLALSDTEYRDSAQKLLSLPSVFWMTRINVPHDFRRQGYGSCLLQRFLRAADDNNISLLCFPSSSEPSLSNERLCDFYLAHGFTTLVPNVLYLYTKADTPMQEATANAPRSLVDVLNRITEVAPDLEPHLASTKSSASFAAPEIQAYWWQQAAVVLNKVAMQHEKAAELMNIFAGRA